MHLLLMLYIYSTPKSRYHMHINIIIIITEILGHFQVIKEQGKYGGESLWFN